MTDIFISYARSTAAQARRVAEALRALGYGVWLDDELPAHRAYAEVIEERLQAAKAVVVVWSAEAAKSEWVQSEADRAREDKKLVQLTIDRAKLPMPFDRIQCADLAGWTGDIDADGWRKVVASIGDLMGSETRPVAASPTLSLPTKPSIALMPFANLSGDPEQDYFADGMVEEIATAMSRCRSIFVIGAGSGLSFKGKGTSPQEAGKILGVRYILDGSVRKSAGRVRIAVKLTDASDGAQIWADRFEDTLEDVFALQDKVALNVVGAIEPAVREADLRRVTARPTENMGSYDLALRGMSRYRSWAKGDVRAGLEMLERAIALDPGYGHALAMAALCHGFLIVYEWSDDPEDSVRKIKALTQRAVDAAPDDAEVLATLVTPAMIVGGPLQAAALAQRAVTLNPGSSLAWLASGVVDVMGGEPQLGLEKLQTSLRLDPRSVWEGDMLTWFGIAHFAQRQFSEAIPILRQAVQLRPHWALPSMVLAASHGQLGERAAAREVIARVRAITSRDMLAFGVGWLDRRLPQLIVDGIALAEGEAPVVTDHSDAR